MGANETFKSTLFGNSIIFSFFVFVSIHILTSRCHISIILSVLIQCKSVLYISCVLASNTHAKVLKLHTISLSLCVSLFLPVALFYLCTLSLILGSLQKTRSRIECCPCTSIQMRAYIISFFFLLFIRFFFVFSSFRCCLCCCCNLKGSAAAISK